VILMKTYLIVMIVWTISLMENVQITTQATTAKELAGYVLVVHMMGKMVGLLIVVAMILPTVIIGHKHILK